MKASDGWSSRSGFVCASLGAAVGLGNIWRFPFIAYQEGGGSFILVYLFALLSAGIPLLILEFTIGSRCRGGVPLCFSTFHPKSEVLAWLQLLLALLVSLYYSLILSWTLRYLFFSSQLSWGENSSRFFFQAIAPNPNLVSTDIVLLSIWTCSLITLAKGVRRGIERISRLFLPLLGIILLFVMARALLLPGSWHGVEMLFHPRAADLMRGRLWIAAYSQVFFSLSVGFGVMSCFAGYLPPRSDIVNNAFICGLINALFSLVSGILVFSVLGFLLQSKGMMPEELSGIGLAFITIPEAVQRLPFAREFASILFFSCIALAAFTSLLALQEALVTAFTERFHRSRAVVIPIYCLIACSLSILFAHRADLPLIRGLDTLIHRFALPSVLIAVLLFFGRGSRLDILRREASRRSEIAAGRWWVFSVKLLTPTILLIFLAVNIREFL